MSKNTKYTMVGEPGYPPESGRKPVDTRRSVRACDAEDCWEPATLLHGTPDNLIYTCDKHADVVIMELLKALTGER